MFHLFLLRTENSIGCIEIGCWMIKIFIEAYYNKSLLKRASEGPQGIPINLEGPLNGLRPLTSPKGE